MISFDFAYYRPDTLTEAIECYHNLVSQNQAVIYYAGGTEIISMARAESIRFDAVIDLKNISQCKSLTSENNDLVIGSNMTLTSIAESGCFPLLCKAVTRIADHTIQDKITLGGNLGGTIIYREAALPLMITNTRVRIMTQKGIRELPFCQVFNGRLQLAPGDFLVQILVDKNDINLPFNHVKKTKMDKIDYPLISFAGNVRGDKIQAAVSGIGSMPMLLSSETLNNTSLTEEERISEIINQVSDRVTSDIQGSKEYRIFVLRNTLSQMFENFNLI